VGIAKVNMIIETKSTITKQNVTLGYSERIHLGTMNGDQFIRTACGLTMAIAVFKTDKPVTCPRCLNRGRNHENIN
jgi:hypothetical protein